MFRVYWTEQESLETQGVQVPPANHVRFKDFDLQQMSKALQFAETLRCRQRAGDAIRHITMSSENPDSVGTPGVSSPSSSYNWKKRRI